MTLGHSLIRMTSILAIAAAAMAASGSSPGRSAKPPAAPSTKADKPAKADFSILVQRNIFDRNRRPPVVRKPPTPRPKPTYTPPKPVDADQYFVLRGIALEGSQFTAFFENTRDGKMLQVRPGDTVGKGRVQAVNIDSAQYQRGDKLTVIPVGHTLTGSRAPGAGFETPAPRPSVSTAKPTAPSPGPSATTQPTTAPAGAPTSAPASGGMQDILERMRRRRQQELGR